MYEKPLLLYIPFFQKPNLEAFKCLKYVIIITFIKR